MTDSGEAVPNLGAQQVRLLHDTIPKQQLQSPKLWIYQYRNGPDKEWNSFYSFGEIEFFQEDFEVMNWWGSAKTLHRWTVLVVRFLREGDDVLFDRSERRQSGDTEIEIVGKVMLVSEVVKVNHGGKTSVARELKSEEDRIKALWDYFGIRLTKEQEDSIQGWDTSLC
jgi:arylamine N-acetyltransferase